MNAIRALDTRPVYTRATEYGAYVGEFFSEMEAFLRSTRYVQKKEEAVASSPENIFTLARPIRDRFKNGNIIRYLLVNYPSPFGETPMRTGQSVSGTVYLKRKGVLVENYRTFQYDVSLTLQNEPVEMVFVSCDNSREEIRELIYSVVFALKLCSNEGRLTIRLTGAITPLVASVLYLLIDFYGFPLLPVKTVWETIAKTKMLTTYFVFRIRRFGGSLIEYLDPLISETEQHFRSCTDPEMYTFKDMNKLDGGIRQILEHTVRTIREKII